MARKKLLFFLEPVLFQNGPLRLGGWHSFFNAFAKCSAETFDCYIAASHAICQLSGDGFQDVFEIDPVALIERHGFDRIEYARDLCLGFDFSNAALMELLSALRQRLDPDVVISPSENQYLKQVFGPERTMFMELGPLPRLGMKTAAYVDPFGHQVRSAFDWMAREPWTHSDFTAFAEAWASTWVARARNAAEANGIAPWLRETAKDRKVLLAVLQPADWLTYEGIGPRIDGLSFLRKLARAVSPDWLVVPQWHSSDILPKGDVLDEVTYDQKNILMPPEALRMAQSEPLLPFVNAVATVSSNVAAAAAVIGTPVRILGQSKFIGLDRNIDSATRARPDLLAFMTCRYCRPLEEWLTVESAFADHISGLRMRPQRLFDPSDLDPRSIEAFMSAA